MSSSVKKRARFRNWMVSGESFVLQHFIIVRKHYELAKVQFITLWYAAETMLSSVLYDVQKYSVKSWFQYMDLIFLTDKIK